jgi:hypothetical protein
MFSVSLIDIFRQIPNQNISFKPLTMKAAFQFANWETFLRFEHEAEEQIPS